MASEADIPGVTGPGSNQATLVNLSVVTHRFENDVELWDTWIVGAPIADKDVTTTLTVAVIDDLNHDGVYNDAPGVQRPERRRPHRRRDLEAIGVASKVETVDFRINGAS